jgi:histidinol-phosphate aminotransferase
MSGPQPLSGLLDIAPYVPGRAGGPGGCVYKLSANESALGASAAAIAAYRDASADLAQYPDGSAAELRRTIGKVHDLDPERIVVGAGSDELISLLILAYCGRGDGIVQSAHGFSYYALAAAAHGAITHFAPERELRADVAALAAAVDARTRLVFIANPNNPTGTYLPASEVEELRDRLPDRVMLVLDGAYAEYMVADDYADGRDMVDATVRDGLSNVVMLRTFSKIHGLGGLRVGWGYFPPAVADVLNRVRGPFNVNRAALAAAKAAMEDVDFVERNRGHTIAERDRVGAALMASGLEIVPSVTNFILFAVPGPDGPVSAQRLLEALAARGVLIRGGASSGLPGHLRVTIGTREANDAFLAALADAL